MLNRLVLTFIIIGACSGRNAYFVLNLNRVSSDWYMLFLYYANW